MFYRQALSLHNNSGALSRKNPNMLIDVTQYISSINVHCSLYANYKCQYLSDGVYNNNAADPPPDLPPRHHHQETSWLPPRPAEDSSHWTDVQGLQTLSWIMESS